MTGTRSRRYHSRYCVGTSPANKPARSPASPSSPSLSKARKRGTTGSPRKRKFEDDALNDEELSLKVVSVMALPVCTAMPVEACSEFYKGEENQGKMSCQVKSKDQTRLETIVSTDKSHMLDLIVNQEGEPRPPPAMDPCISLDMQDAYDLGPIMSPLPCDSISIDTMVPSTLGYWDSLLRAESPDPLDTISDERNNELLGMYEYYSLGETSG